MPQIVEMVEELVQKDKAYVVDGEVLYKVRSFAEYGKLSHKNIDDLRGGTRVEANDRKSDSLDFALLEAC